MRNFYFCVLVQHHLVEQRAKSTAAGAQGCCSKLKLTILFFCSVWESYTANATNKTRAKVETVMGPVARACRALILPMLVGKHQPVAQMSLAAPVIGHHKQTASDDAKIQAPSVPKTSLAAPGAGASQTNSIW
jgi:hypothetical protein